MDKYSMGYRIRYRRQELGLTQKQVSHASGIAQDELSKIERGIVGEIRSTRLRELARALRVSSDWLLDLETVS